MFFSYILCCLFCAPLPNEKTLKANKKVKNQCQRGRGSTFKEVVSINSKLPLAVRYVPTRETGQYQPLWEIGTHSFVCLQCQELVWEAAPGTPFTSLLTSSPSPEDLPPTPSDHRMPLRITSISLGCFSKPAVC